MFKNYFNILTKPFNTFIINGFVMLNIKTRDIDV